MNLPATCMSRRSQLERLRATAPSVLPSMLLCDFGNLEREVRRLEEAGVPGFHLDVMDGHFVPNLTYGLPLVEAFRRLTPLPLDVHLMISNPADFVKSFHEAGSDVITIHAEAVERPREVLEQIRELGAGAGLAINPPTPLETVGDALDACDLVLVMSVMPGFGGQKFNPVALDKLRALRQRVDPAVVLEIDGGVNDATIGSCVEAGAELLVVGSAILGHPDYKERVASLRALASES